MPGYSQVETKRLTHSSFDNNSFKNIFQKQRGPCGNIQHSQDFKKHRPFEPAITLKDRCESVFLSMDVHCSFILAGKKYKEADKSNN